ncbi:TnsD family transposase [Staphylococcus haemolyticus]|uniref:TnsD family transposase n=1 Tax=Staphylococcus haemolyticus TaxID=1283 RepID=UPI001F0B4A79|nr:TnsD family transposase [Staphylococcus haemolyticus]MCH4460905.1 TnsD family transposase [Staphylococcus haemolyticus]
MLPFFTNPYPDELLYSAVARYHFYNGNIDCKDTLKELFGSRSVISSVGIGSHLSFLANQLGEHYSVESLLANHTIYPYYASFLSKERQQEILEDVKGDGKGLYARLGFVAGGICRKDGLYYCSKCAKADVEKYGEPYIHREHQLEAINYCSHHEIRLRKYPIQSDSRIEYVRFELKHMNFSELEEVDPYKSISVGLAKLAYQLLQLPLHQLNRSQIRMKYNSLLQEKNLMTAGKRIRQKELYEAFSAFYPQDFLKQYESNLDEDYEYNWLKILLRNSKRHVHPFRHVLFLYFMKQNIETLQAISDYTSAFGEGPFPCLNKAASHYKECVIPKVKVTKDFKSKNLIGTFTCSCGFIYARKQTTNHFEIGRVKQFGDVWQQMLYQLKNENLSIRAIARMLGVDAKTVKKYLGENLELNKVEDKQLSTSRLQECKQQWQELRVTYPQISRTALREKNKAVYMYLYRHDKKWLLTNCPKMQSKAIQNIKIDWAKRDKQYVHQIKFLHKRMLKEEKPIRITVSAIGRRLSILANLQYHLDKLPLTESLLNQITETVREFQIRRTYKIIDELMIDGAPIKLWQVQRKAAIKSHQFKEIKAILEAYIQHKRDVLEDERTLG